MHTRSAKATSGAVSGAKDTPAEAVPTTDEPRRPRGRPKKQTTQLPAPVPQLAPQHEQQPPVRLPQENPPLLALPPPLYLAPLQQVVLPAPAVPNQVLELNAQIQYLQEQLLQQQHFFQQQQNFQRQQFMQWLLPPPIQVGTWSS